MTARGVAAAGLALILTATVSCEQEPRPVEPPMISYGQAVCDRCGMIISEERHAAGLMIEDEEGRAYRVFDDVAAVVLFSREHPEVRVLGRWVKDYATRGWLNADSAAYVRGEEVQTPMAFGIVATAPSRADSLAGALGGSVLTWSELRAMADTGGIESSPGRRGGP